MSNTEVGEGQAVMDRLTTEEKYTLTLNKMKEVMGGLYFEAQIKAEANSKEILTLRAELDKLKDEEA